MQTLIIDCQQWLRGEGHEKSFLIRESDNKMCCLGFLGRQCGYEKNELLGIRDPLMKGFDYSRFPKKLWMGIAFDCIIHTNDSKYLTEESRKEELQEHFRFYLNINLKFVN